MSRKQTQGDWLLQRELLLIKAHERGANDPGAHAVLGAH